MPRPTHKPTRETRTVVKTLAGIGISQRMICQQIGLGSTNTLEKHYRKELDEGMATTVVNMAKSFYLTCLNSTDWRAKNRWLRLFGGPQWDDRETVEVTGPNGGPVPIAVVDEIIRAARTIEVEPLAISEPAKTD